MTCLLAAAALDALFLIDDRAAIDDVDGILGANLGAGMRQTALTALGDYDLLLRAGMAGKLNDVDERRLIVLLLGRALFDAIRDRLVSRSGAHRHTHCQTQTLAYNRTLQENAVTVRCTLTGQDLVGQPLHGLCIIVALIRHTRNFASPADST